MLKSNDFYSDINSIIFSVVYDLYRQNKPIDLITVKERLDDKKLLDKV
jgi:replicative DNA helicase